MYIRRYLFWLLLSRFPIARMHNQCNEEKTVQARRRRRRWSECGTYLKPVFSTDLPVPHRVPAWHCSPPVWKNACQSSWCQPGIASIGGSQHQLCQNCCLCWSFWFQVSVTMFHPLQEMEWKNDVSWILIGFLLLEGKAKCLSSTLWQLEGGIGNIEFQSALFWLWMSMLWRIMVAVEALVVLMQGYQSHEQTNLVMILVNLLPGANSGILVPSAKCQWWCTWWMSDGSSGCQTWSGADFASFENWLNLYLGICWRQGFVLLAFKHLKCQYL